MGFGLKNPCASIVLKSFCKTLLSPLMQGQQSVGYCTDAIKCLNCAHLLSLYSCWLASAALCNCCLASVLSNIGIYSTCTPFNVDCSLYRLYTLVDFSPKIAWCMEEHFPTLQSLLGHTLSHGTTLHSLLGYTWQWWHDFTISSHWLYTDTGHDFTLLYMVIQYTPTQDMTSLSLHSFLCYTPTQDMTSLSLSLIIHWQVTWLHSPLLGYTPTLHSSIMLISIHSKHVLVKYFFAIL